MTWPFYNYFEPDAVSNTHVAIYFFYNGLIAHHR